MEAERFPKIGTANKTDVESKKTNAAWASHPGRIVIADVLTAVFRQGERSSRNRTRKSAMHQCP
jgi:hypothetical protein